MKHNFGTQKKWALKRKFLKNAISETETIEFRWKMMILRGESFPLTYFQSKSFANLPQIEFWRKKKNEHQNENFVKNAISEA